MYHFTFIAILKGGRHVHRTGRATDLDLANRELGRMVRMELTGEAVSKFWYMLGEHESQEYTPEEMREVFFGD